MKSIDEAKSIWQFSALKYSLYVLVGIIPLFVSYDLFFPYATPKVLLLSIATSLLVILYCWGRIREKVSVFNIGWGHGILFLFLISLVVSALLGIDPQYSFFGSITNGTGVLLLLSCITIAYLVAFTVRREELFMRNILTTTVCSGILVVCGLYLEAARIILPLSTKGSTLGNSSYAGGYLLFCACFAVGLFLIYKKWWQKLLMVVSFLIITLSPVLFNSRIFCGIFSLDDVAHHPLSLSGSANGAFIGLGISIAIITSVILLRSHKKSIQYAGGILCLLLFAGIFVVGTVFSNPTSALHQKYIQEKTSNRFLFWDIASEAAHQKPLFGWGTNNYSYVYQEKFSPLLFSKGYVAETWTDSSHNIFKDYVVSNGYVGLVLFLTLLGFSAITLFRATTQVNQVQKIVNITFLGALVGYGVQGIFIFDTVVPLFIFFIVIGYALGISKTKEYIVPEIYSRLKLLIGVGVFIVVGYLLVLSVQGWQEMIAWKKYTSIEIVMTEQNPQHLSRLGYIGDSAYVADMILAYIEEEQKRDFFFSNKEVLLSAIILNLEADQKNAPYKNFRTEWVLGRAYGLRIAGKGVVDQSLLVEAENHYKKAFEINPSNPETYLGIANVYVGIKEYEKAYPWIRAAIALAPEYEEGYKMATQVPIEGIKGESFVQYVEKMKMNWCSDSTLCARGLSYESRGEKTPLSAARYCTLSE